MIYGPKDAARARKIHACIKMGLQEQRTFPDFVTHCECESYPGATDPPTVSVSLRARKETPKFNLTSEVFLPLSFCFQSIDKKRGD